jgi:hypothetical protein
MTDVGSTTHELSQFYSVQRSSWAGDKHPIWKHFDHEFKLEEKSVNNASNTGDASYSVDTNWYTDTGATHHITFELDKLTTKEKYTRKEKIQMASGSGMGINYIGNSTLHTPTRNLYLNKVLYVPSTHKKSYLY